MKKLLSIIMLLSAYCSNGQNYQCLQYNSKNFFINGNGYLRGIRIDSVRIKGNDTIYYPYHTPRGAFGCNGLPKLDSTGGSWLGKNVIEHADGTYLFDDIWQDTVVIETQAHLGDTWTFFEDTTQFSYKATVTALGTMAVLGTVDSVKTITIEADSGGVVNPSDPVNNFQIILSKHNGFVQVFDLYTFPYHRPDMMNTYRQFFDYYLDLVLGNLSGTIDVICYAPSTNSPDTINSVFRLIAFHSPTRMEIYNFSTGDIFESLSSQEYELSSPSSVTITTTTVDTVLSKITTPYSISYTDAIRTRTTQEAVSGTTIIAQDYATGSSSTYDTSLLFDFSKLPEEWLSGYFFYYYPGLSQTNNNSGYQCPNTNYTIGYSNIDYTADSVLFEWDAFSDGASWLSVSNVSYGIGYGQTGMSYTDYTLYGFNKYEEYTYVDKNDTSCGTFEPIPLSTENITLPISNLEVFPNPAQNDLNISASSAINDVTITNLLGQTLFVNKYNGRHIQIDITQLPAGIYLVRINSTEVRKFVKE